MKGIGCAAILLLLGMAGPAHSQVSPDADRAHSRQNHINAHVILGEALQIKGDLDGAIAEFQEAIRLNPTFVNAQNSLAGLLESKNDYKAALGNIREASKIRR